MQIDTWPKANDHAIELAGLVIASSHVVFLVLMVLWFVLKKPTSVKLFRLRLRAALRGQPLPKRLPPVDASTLPRP